MALRWRSTCDRAELFFLFWKQIFAVERLVRVVMSVKQDAIWLGLCLSLNVFSASICRRVKKEEHTRRRINYVENFSFECVVFDSNTKHWYVVHMSGILGNEKSSFFRDENICFPNKTVAALVVIPIPVGEWVFMFHNFTAQNIPKLAKNASLDIHGIKWNLSLRQRDWKFR